jgi:hypothetical protein
MGMFASENIYSDLDIAKIETLPLTQLHREIDLAIVEAGREGNITRPRFLHHLSFDRICEDLYRPPCGDLGDRFQRINRNGITSSVLQASANTHIDGSWTRQSIDCGRRDQHLATRGNQRR